MKTLTATYRIVTPMFLGGADPTSQAELRVPSIKGALRFWWRALMWGKVNSVEELRRRESELFGSTKPQIGQSRVLIFAEQPLVEANTEERKWSPSSWKSYTGYGLRDKKERRFLSPGKTFTIHFVFRRCSDEQRSQVLSAAKLLGLAGGLGGRSRRGWGSVTLTELKGADWICPDTPEQWQQSMSALIKPGSNLPPYTAFSPQSQWNCGPAKNDAASAHAWIGERYQMHVKATYPKASRSQFGLPRLFKGDTPPRRDRRASPLMLHVHQCSNGKALPVALWLPATFLPTDSGIPGNGDSAVEFVNKLSTEQ